MKTKKIFLAVGAVLALAGASAHATTVLFDHDQDNTFSQASGFDWFPGNALSVDSLTDGQLNVGDIFTTYYQAELGSFSGAGNTSLPVGNAGPYEYTGIAVIQEEVTFVADTNGDGVQDLVKFKHVGGTFKMYYDDLGGTTNADGITGNTGLGYDDGKLILTADVTLGGANFTLADPLNTDLLDKFGADDLGGTQTVVGNGNTNVEGPVTFVDSNFLKGINPGESIVKLFWDSTLAAPFDSINPEKSIVGQTPNYGPDNLNGPSVGAQGNEDFHFEADGNMSVETKTTVPEPASLALVSLGLLGMGAVSRKKKV